MLVFWGSLEQMAAERALWRAPQLLSTFVSTSTACDSLGKRRMLQKRSCGCVLGFFGVNGFRLRKSSSEGVPIVLNMRLPFPTVKVACIVDMSHSYISLCGKRSIMSVLLGITVITIITIITISTITITTVLTIRIIIITFKHTKCWLLLLLLLNYCFHSQHCNYDYHYFEQITEITITTIVAALAIVASIIANTSTHISTGISSI